MPKKRTTENELSEPVLKKRRDEGKNGVRPPVLSKRKVGVNGTFGARSPRMAEKKRPTD